MRKVIVNLLACFVCFSEFIQLIFGILNQRKETDLMNFFYSEYILIASICSFFIIIIFTVVYNGHNLLLRLKMINILVIVIALIVILFQLLRLFLYDIFYVPAYVLLFYSIYIICKVWCNHDNTSLRKR